MWALCIILNTERVTTCTCIRKPPHQPTRDIQCKSRTPDAHVQCACTCFRTAIGDCGVARVHVHVYTWVKTISGGARQTKQPLDSTVSSCCFEFISSHQQGIRASLSSALPVYIHKAQQNTSGSAVSELMRFIHHLLTYIVPATHTRALDTCVNR